MLFFFVEFLFYEKFFIYKKNNHMTMTMNDNDNENSLF